MSVDITVKRKEGQPQKAVKNSMRKAFDYTALELKGNLARNSPVDQGYLRGSWHPDGMGDDNLRRRVWSSAKYATYVNFGTGIYGPRGAMITPKNAKALRWEGRGGVVFSMYSSGQPARKFVEKSIQQTKPRIPEFITRAVQEESGDL